MAVIQDSSTLILAELLLWDLWKTAAEWWARFWGSFPLLGLRALSHGHNLVEEAFDVACLAVAACPTHRGDDSRNLIYIFLSRSRSLRSRSPPNRGSVLVSREWPT
ncbi:hypothetical protein V5799_030096 [Amblyomma americanum]|uniref:Secreted protein n=1 Tax=Amblyomma americanum TaxID=6943 RepID=A0AAQ4EPC8_AMBAM